MMKWEDVKKKSDEKLDHPGLNPIVRHYGKLLVDKAYKAGVAVCITQTVRTTAEQNALYRQGRYGNPGKIVTNVQGGYSFHNHGLAIDFALYTPDGRSVVWDEFVDYDKDGVRDWYEVVKIAKGLGFEWGGDWGGFRDAPHFQMDFGLTCQQLLNGKKAPTTIPGGGSVKKPAPAKKKPVNKPKDVGTAVVKFPGKPLYLGAEGMDPKDIKRIENALGLKPDGKFDKALEKAVRAYQKRKKLEVDGAVGLITWNVLF